MWILALAPQGPGTGFLKLCFLQLFISRVLPREKWHCCHASLGTHRLVGIPQLWEVGSRGSLAVLPGGNGGTRCRWMHVDAFPCPPAVPGV